MLKPKKLAENILISDVFVIIVILLSFSGMVETPHLNAKKKLAKWPKAINQ
jgi:hypothetical protein